MAEARTKKLLLTQEIEIEFNQEDGRSDEDVLKDAVRMLKEWKSPGWFRNGRGFSIRVNKSIPRNILEQF